MNKTVIQPVERTVLTRNIIALKQLAELRAHSDIFIPMRGMALLLSGFYRIGERDMEDIDLCVSPDTRELFFAVLKSLKYSLVPSGEWCFRRYPYELPVDVHLEFLPVLKKRETKEWEGQYFVLPDAESLLLNLLHHVYYQHHQLRPCWQEDYGRLKKGFSGDISKSAEECGLDRARQALETGREFLKSDYSGHIVSILDSNKRFSQKIRVFIDKLFPGRDFLKRRYGLTGAAEPFLFLFFHPLLLIRNFFIFLFQAADSRINR